MLSRIFFVAAGGAIGAVLRYSLNLLFAKTFAPFPFATFFINVTGSFLIGFLACLFAEKFPDQQHLRLLFSVGLLGAYTTFSTFELETFELLREKQLALSFLYAAASFAIGLFGVIAGYLAAKKF